MKVLFLFPYPHGTAASQRFRFEQYLGFLRKEGIAYRLEPFWDAETWRILYKPGHVFQKAKGIAKGVWHRCKILFSVPHYDFVFIHREAAPLGPPVFEWIIAKVLGKRIIFDFDDAIWLPNTSGQNKVAARLKWHSKTKSICRWAWKISVGNNYLANRGLEFRNNSAIRNPQSAIFVIPTTIDTENLHNRVKDQRGGDFVIGWTGTHSTIGYLESLIPVLQKLEKEWGFTFLVISDQPPAFALQSLLYVPWNKATEMDDLLRMNIGVMPLADDAWSQGKCGFKALQYMALGIPALASPVGVNTDIVEHGENGFLCRTPGDWENSISEMIQTPDRRQRMGQAARRTVEERYSVTANRRAFLGLFTA